MYIKPHDYLKTSSILIIQYAEHDDDEDADMARQLTTIITNIYSHTKFHKLKNFSM